MQHRSKTTRARLAALSLLAWLPCALGATPPPPPVDVAYTVNFFPNDLPPLSLLAREVPDGPFEAVTDTLPLFSLTPIADGPDGLLYMLFGDTDEELEIAAVSPTSNRIVSRVPVLLDPDDPIKFLLPVDLTFDRQGRLFMLTSGGTINRGCFPGCTVLPRLVEIDPITGISRNLLTFERPPYWSALTADEDGLLVSTQDALYRLDPQTGDTTELVQYGDGLGHSLMAADFDSQGKLVVTARGIVSVRRSFFSIDLETGLSDELPSDPYDEPFAVAIRSAPTELPIPTLGSLGLVALVMLLALLGLRRLPVHT